MLTRGKVFCLFAIALWLCAAVLHGRVKDANRFEPGYALNEQARELGNTSVFAQIMGEIRSSMADIMWIKTERYLHAGVAWSAHINATKMSQSGEVEGDHENITMMIPEKQNDYRGYVGDLHRIVAPWSAPDTAHKHEAGEEMLPWYRLATLSDPHYIRAYVIGAWWLMKQKDGERPMREEALEFIDEGIRNNPDRFQLYLMRARILMAQERWQAALDPLTEAVEIASRVRPEEGKAQPPRWDDDREEDFAACLRFRVMLAYRKLDDLGLARRYLDVAMTYLPNDGPLNNLATQIGRSE